MPFIHAVHTAFPDNVVSQEDLRDLIISFWPDKKDLLDQFFISTDVKTRHLTLPPKEYRNLGDFGNRNKIWREEAVNLQEQNITSILTSTNIHLDDIKLIASVNTTGLSVPSLEALLMNKIPFNTFTKRLPIFGLGCLGGVAGMNRVYDYLLGHPDEAALLLVTELCSLTFQLSDVNVSNQVGTALFGDGAGAILLLGNNHRLIESSSLEIVGVESFFYPDTERMMGWDMVEDGFKIVLSPGLPDHVRKFVGGNVNRFIRKCGLERKDLDFFVAHPGGPKVLEAVEEVLELKRTDTILSWESLEEVGNVSAVSVINILERTLKRKDIKKGAIGLMMSMGPAFSLELAMVKKC